MASINSTTSGTTSSLSAKTGIGGLVSGMDIDQLVESLTARSREKIIKQQQLVQKLQWKQTSYRSVATALREFQSKYLDVVSATNFRSTSFFNTVKATSSSDAVSVAGTSNAAAGSITINSITRLATAQTVESRSAASQSLTGKETVADIINNLQAGESINMNLDGRVKTITFDNEFVNAVQADPSTFQSKFQALVDKAFGVTGTADRVITVAVDGDNHLSFNAPGSKLILSSVGENTALATLGFDSGQSNKIAINAALDDLTLDTPLTEGDQVFEINGETFTFKSTDTLRSIMEKINGSKAGVTISYSSITDKFTMTAKNTGSGDNIVISETEGNLMTALGLTGAGAKVTAGENAILTVNDQNIVRSSNTFEIDGVKITLNETSGTPVTLTMKEDATSLNDTIHKFVEDYNAMISLMQGLTKEKVNKDFPPLTDTQKGEMTETQIKDWEAKAKSGILRSDPLLGSIATKLQETIAGLSINGFSLYSMGISTSGYTEGGKLKIEESKLKEALETKGSEIRELFTSPNGLGNALNTIITDATKYSGPKGSRGSLIEAAGFDNTTSDTENSIYDQIKRANKNIDALQVRLKSEEARYWSKFTYMESVINGLNSQGALLSSFSNPS